MSKHTFTPGPWWNEEFTILCGDREDPEIIATTAVDDMMAVDDPTGQIDEANARLIAAAPELLEACKGLLSFIQTFNMGGDWEQSNYPAIKTARAAIAQAEGGQS